MELTVGIKGRAERVVTEEMTARAMGSGALDVLATPCMAALMEEAAWKSIQPALEPGQGSVGTALELTHDAPTPVGMRIWAESELTQVEGRKCAFTITAYDEAGPIGRAQHTRVLIRNESFFARCQAKKEG